VPILHRYYRVRRDDNDSYPLLDWSENALPYMRARPIRDPHVIELTIGDPVPDDIQMVDFHALPKPVFHNRLKQVFGDAGAFGGQVIPVAIQMPDGAINNEYFCLHLYNKVTCADVEKSVCGDMYASGRMMMIEKLVLDGNVLNKMPTAERIAFRPWEAPQYTVFHHTLVEKLEAMKPVGCCFEPLECTKE
jgi:hypothetical protein